MHMPVTLLMASERRSATVSSQPQRRWRPVVAPNSWPFSPRCSPVLVEQLGGKRPGADAGGVGLDDAQHVIEVARADAAAAGRAAGRGVGRGHVGIGAVIDIEQRALGALEHDVPAFRTQGVQQAGNVGDHGGDLLALGQGLVEDRLDNPPVPP